MIELPDPSRLVRLAEQMGAQEAEVYLVGGVYRYAEASDNRIVKAAVDAKTMVGVRVAVGKSVASAGGEIASPGDVERLIEKAISLARAGPEDPNWPGFNPQIGESAPVEIFDPRVEETSLETVVSLLRSSIDRRLEVREARVDVASGAAEAEVTHVAYANSNGGPLENRSTLFSIMLELRAEQDGSEGTYIDYVSKARFDEKMIESMVSRAYECVVDAVRARPWETMRTTVILDHSEAASILGLMIPPAVSAEQVQQGRSPLAGKVGQQVLSPELSLVDDPFLPWEPSSASFDDEGHPTRRTTIIGSGVLETYLYDHYTASRDGVESTGNAARSRPWSRPSPAPHNLVLESRVHVEDRDRFLSSFDQAVLIVSTIGSWMSNPVSGQVNATITLGYLLRHGSVEEVVKSLTWGDNLYRALGEGFHGSGGGRECREGVCTGMLAVSDSTLAGR